MMIQDRAAELWVKAAQGISATTAIVSSISLNGWGILVGIVCTIIVSVYSMYCKHRHVQIAELVAQQNALCVNCPKVQGDD